MIRAAVAVIIALVFLVAVQTWRLSGAIEERDAAQLEAARLVVTERTRRATVAKLEAAQLEAARLDRELQEGVGADAPLSDYLRRGAGRVWP